MEFVTEAERKLPVTAECDVFVAGGGIAGAAAGAGGGTRRGKDAPVRAGVHAWRARYVRDCDDLLAAV